ncbi:MAG: outer membrane beta-barrel protein [Nitrospira sp.]|nr:outer membrane beta-barrel protein [Nitrospira sp.]
MNESRTTCISLLIAAVCGLQLGEVSDLAAQTNPTWNDSRSGSKSVPALLGSDANLVSANPLSARLLKPDATGVTRVFPQDTFIRARGWIDAGYTYNTSSPTSHFNGPYNAIDRDIPQLNQLYLILDRPLQPGGAWSIGGRVDVLYGYDFFLAQSNGLERRANGTPHWNQSHYGLAIPQAYAEVGND